MSKSLSARIFDALVFAVVNFVIFSIFFKIVFNREDWLTFSILWSILGAIGRFTSYSIATLKKSTKFILILELVIIVAAFLVGALVMGVWLNIAQWERYLLETIIPFGSAIIITNIFIIIDKDRCSRK